MLDPVHDLLRELRILYFETIQSIARAAALIGQVTQIRRGIGVLRRHGIARSDVLRLRERGFALLRDTDGVFEGFGFPGEELSHLLSGLEIALGVERLVRVDLFARGLGGDAAEDLVRYVIFAGGIVD